MKRICTLLIASLVVSAGLVGSAEAAIKTYDFHAITANSTGVTGLIADTGFHLRMDVIGGSGVPAGVLPGGGSLGAEQVAFRFYFDGGPSQMGTITQAAFDDGTLLDIAAVYGVGAAVSFTQAQGEGFSPHPPTLPGGNTLSPPFEVSSIDVGDTGGKKPKNIYHYFDAGNAPPVSNGVSSGEELWIVYTLQSSQTWTDTISALEDPIGTEPDLRVGLHVQQMGTNSASNSYVNNQHPVPEPASLVVWSLLGSAGALAALRSRKRRGWSDENRQGIYDAINRS